MGSWGRMACFSFQGTKPLPALEGGMGNYQIEEDFELIDRVEIQFSYRTE